MEPHRDSPARQPAIESDFQRDMNVMERGQWPGFLDEMPSSDRNDIRYQLGDISRIPRSMTGRLQS